MDIYEADNILRASQWKDGPKNVSAATLVEAFMVRYGPILVDIRSLYGYDVVTMVRNLLTEYRELEKRIELTSPPD